MTSPPMAWRSAAGGSRKLGLILFLPTRMGLYRERKNVAEFSHIETPPPTLIALYEVLMQEER